MREVAELAGVSVQTVSNHLNGRHQYMAEDTRERVAEAMRKLGYHPNVAARALRSAETRTLAFLILDRHKSFLADPLTDLIVAGVADVAREEEYGILIQAAAPSDDPDRLLSPVLQSRVDGAFLILSGEPAVRAEVVRRIATVTDSFVVFDEHPVEVPCMSVRAEDREGGRMLTAHLIERGHRRIAFVGAAEPWAVVEQRYLGFEDGLKEAGLEPDPGLVKMEAGWEPSTAVPIATALLERDDRPTAIVCTTDLLALATMDTALARGLAVPEDLAVCGFDDFPFSEFARPALTTVRIPAYEMGREAARILIGHLAPGASGTLPEHKEFPVELMTRSST